MSRGRALTAGALVTLAVFLQVSVLARLSLPGGGPALLVLVVAAVALAEGPAAGMLAGFAGGLLADLTPPSDHPLGQSVLVLVLTGEVVGLARRRTGGLIRPLALVGLATALAGAGVAGLGMLLGQPVGGFGALVLSVAAATAYNIVLAPALLLLPGSTGQRAVAPGWDRHTDRRQERNRALRGLRRRHRVGSSAAAGGLR